MPEDTHAAPRWRAALVARAGTTQWVRSSSSRQTRRIWGADGNGDGQGDPNQIEDAALAAAHYLCHARDLSSAEGWRWAVFSCNHFDSGLDDVARAANSYRS